MTRDKTKPQRSNVLGVSHTVITREQANVLAAFTLSNRREAIFQAYVKNSKREGVIERMFNGLSGCREDECLRSSSSGRDDYGRK
jgi:hypothetical protein